MRVTTALEQRISRLRPHLPDWILQSSNYLLDRFTAMCQRPGRVLARETSGLLRSNDPRWRFPTLPQIQATLAGMPRWVMGWFVGKNKPPAAGRASSGTEPPPAVRERRPRRRRG